MCKDFAVFCYHTKKRNKKLKTKTVSNNSRDHDNNETMVSSYKNVVR